MSHRYQKFLRERYRSIAGYTAAITAIIGAFMLTPILFLPLYLDEIQHIWAFVVTGLPPLVIGYALYRRYAPANGEALSVLEGMVIVTVSWVLALLIGALPFMLIGDLTFTQAVFDSTSGWTTTGLSVVAVPEDALSIILFHRSMLQLVGGAGFAIIILSAVTGPSGMGLTAAEGRTDQLVPHVKRSASIVLTIYSGYTIAGILLLWLAGMSLFDAINHSFAAVSTGGFSTRTLSVGYWDSFWIEIIIIVLMILGATNFLTAYTLMKGKFYLFINNGEVRLMFVLIVFFAPLLFVGVTAPLYATLDKAARVALFEVVSALTTTGFSTVPYSDWSDAGWLTLIILMLIGGGTGSTAGGIKLFRVYGLYRGLKFQLKRAFLPAHAITVPDTYLGENRHFYDSDEMNRIGQFVFLYASLYLAGVLITSLYGFTMRESMFEFASAIGDVGLSIGLTVQAPDGLLWWMTAAMFFGRLEFFTIIVGTMKLLQDVRLLAFDPDTRLERRTAKRAAANGQKKASPTQSTNPTPSLKTPVPTDKSTSTTDSIKPASN